MATFEKANTLALHGLWFVSLSRAYCFGITWMTSFSGLGNVGQIPHELFTILIICSSVQKNSHVKSQNNIKVSFVFESKDESEDYQVKIEAMKQELYNAVFSTNDLRVNWNSFLS
uniref:Uncharacterized protein n=1 Tax=Rhizophagus irregularis (strain DAOM 181602 / DAOM 197198 / MUCL 43194) TaxID=747089 RepID=U9T4B8_RHIID